MSPSGEISLQGRLRLWCTHLGYPMGMGATQDDALVHAISRMKDAFTTEEDFGCTLEEALSELRDRGCLVEVSGALVGKRWLLAHLLEE